MENHRIYGALPTRIALVHGGPGAPGYMAPVAHRLSHTCGVAELLQTQYSIDALIDEMQDCFFAHCATPAIVIGHSWGAWLSILFAAQYSRFIEKLILVGSASLDEAYTTNIEQTRLSRLRENDRKRVEQIRLQISSTDPHTQNSLFTLFGKLMSKADSYSPKNIKSEMLEGNYRQNIRIWSEAVEIRRNGKLMEAVKQIQCPIVVIHGDYDPHPVAGVTEPLDSIGKPYEFHLLDKCGHYPWNEEFASEQFFSVL